MSEDEKKIIENPIIPVMRIYLSAATPDGDLLHLYELKDWISQLGPAETVKDLLEKGIYNIYLSCFDDVEKVS